MILVDSSVWIAQLRGHRTPATAKLEAAASRELLLIGDLILLEVLQGARDEAHAARIERGMRGQVISRLRENHAKGRLIPVQQGLAQEASAWHEPTMVSADDLLPSSQGSGLVA